MTDRSLTHGSFTLERTYNAPPSLVYHAFSDEHAKRTWFGGPPDWDHLGYTFDFCEGGEETDVGGPKGGPVSSFTATYHDIVPNERIVHTYEMSLNDVRISVSVASFEFHAAGTGTRLVMTEHGIYLDGYDDAGKREEGYGYLLDALGAALTTMQVPA